MELESVIKRTARRNITVELESVIKEQPEGIFYTVGLESVIKGQPEGILHTVELESVIKEQPEGILQWS